jgi:hypothetical protein
MAMRVEKTVPFLGRDVKVRELTIAEIREWLAKAQVSEGEGTPDVVTMLLFNDLSLDEMQEFTDITSEEISGATPSQLEEIKEFCKKVNSHFFALRAQLMEIGLQAMGSGKSS